MDSTSSSVPPSRTLDNSGAGSSEEESTISPHEVLTEDGTLIFGDLTPMRVRRTIGFRKSLRRQAAARFLLWDDENDRIEMSLVIAEDIADEIEDPVF